MTEQSSITDVSALVTQKLEQDLNFMPQTFAAEIGVPVERIIEALPEDMRVFAPGAESTAIWEAMTEWEKITFMATTPGAILEIPCRLPKGKTGHGMYNLMDKSSPLCGHILVDKITSVWFVSKPLFGVESHSVQFFDRQGHACFGVYLGRDEKRQIIPSVKEGFLALRSRYAGTRKASGSSL